MHPAISGGGEVTRICPDHWHDGDPVTEHARQQQAEREAVASGSNGCPFCWGTGHVTVMEPPGVPVERPCPEGCLAPEEVPF